MSGNAAELAKSIGNFGEGLGSLADEVRRISDGLAHADDPRRSPIEVVLQGLTRPR